MGLFDWLFGSRAKESAAPSSAGRTLPTGQFGKARHKPEGKWVQTTMVVAVMGINHRRSDVEAYCRAVHRSEKASEVYGVTLRPDPANAHDKNAIAIHGHAGVQSWHIGFLDRDTAAEITRDLVSKGIPIAGELYSIWIGVRGASISRSLCSRPRATR